MFNMLNSWLARKERTRLWCAKFSPGCPHCATVLGRSSGGVRISLNKWALEIADFSRLAFELPSLLGGQHSFEFAAERTDSDHGYRF
jgi:hypothetical protein